MKIGVIGKGYVGKAIYNLFKDHYEIVAKDKEGDYLKINECDLSVVCVPTPMNKDGSCDTSIVEEVIKWIEAPLILIKSTVPPGTTFQLKRRWGKRICFSPEYVGEGGYYIPEWQYPHPTKIESHTFLVVGGDKKDTSEIVDIFQEKLGPTKKYVQTDANTAELTKYMENIWGAMKVTFSNEFYSIAKAFNVDYNELRELFLLDSRTEPMHTSVFPNKRGFAGKCYPKDLHGLIEATRQAGYESKLLEEVVDTNIRIRKATNPDNKDEYDELFE